MTHTNIQELWDGIIKEFPDGGIIGISGYGGAGKTELGKALGRDRQGIQLVHVDDYLDWPKICERNEDGDGVNFQSIVDAHIIPFKNGKKPVEYLIIEGIKLFNKSRQKHFDYRIWVDTPIDKANGNGQARDKENQKLWDEVWVPNELAFEKKHNPKQYADALYSWKQVTSKLIIIRGPSGAGKSTVSKELLKRSNRSTLLISEDQIRKMFNNHHKPGHDTSKKIATNAVKTGLSNGYDVIYEGILNLKTSGNNLDDIFSVHADENYMFYLDVSLEETLLRHDSRPEKSEFEAETMKKWWSYASPSGSSIETIISESSLPEDTVKTIANTCGLDLGNEAEHQETMNA